MVDGKRVFGNGFYDEHLKNYGRFSKYMGVRFWKWMYEVHAFYTRSVDDDSELPPALGNIIRSINTLELKSHTYSEHGTFESFTRWKLHSAEMAEESACSSIVDAITETRRYSGKRLCRKPSVSTPLKPSEEKKTHKVGPKSNRCTSKQEELEDSDARLSHPLAKGKKKKRCVRFRVGRPRPGDYTSQGKAVSMMQNK
ncbi:hypothetical protein Tco_0844398 [Tanacetum coccineum]